MEMIIGGAFQGKEEYALKKWPERRFISGETAQLNDLLKAQGILGFQNYVRKEIHKGSDLTELPGKIIDSNPDVVIVCDETGCGIVPVDPEERLYRETLGRLCTALAAYSDKVTRIVSGLPLVIKDLTEELTILLIRHGKTAGNLEARYVGCRTDEPLCPEGIDDLRNFKIGIPERVFTSGMRRCLETSEILFPGRKHVLAEDLRECDFGRFENRNYKEMSADPEYQAWIDSGGKLPFPGGESREEFRSRCVSGFEKITAQCILERVHTAAVIAHGGTIRNILSTFEPSGRDFYDWQIDNGDGVSVRIKPDEWNKGLHTLSMVLKNQTLRGKMLVQNE